MSRVSSSGVRLFDLRVESHSEVADDSLRGRHTAYRITCTAADSHGLRHCTANRRFSEWRTLHAALSKQPFPEPRRLSHSQWAKLNRQVALQKYLLAAIEASA